MLCAGSVDQVDSSPKSQAVSCDLQGGETYQFFPVTDIDGAGDGATHAALDGSDLTFTVPATTIAASVSSADYSAVTVQYTASNIVAGGEIAFGVVQSGSTAPTTVAEINALPCTGSATMVDQEQYTVSLNCEVTAKTNYQLYVASNNGNIVEVDFESAVPTVTINDGEMSGTSENFVYAYQIENPAHGGGVLYWYVRVDPNDAGDIVFLPTILDGSGATCSGTVPQVDEASHQDTIACAMSGGETYQVWTAYDTDYQQGDFGTKFPAATFTVPEPVITASASEISEAGFRFNYAVTNPTQGANLYYAVTLSSAGTPSTSSLVSQDGLCPGSVLQGTGSVTVSCSLTLGESYTLWVASDDSDSSSAAVALVDENGQTFDITNAPSKTPSAMPTASTTTVAPFDCSPDRLASLLATGAQCFDALFTCASCCETGFDTSGTRICFPDGALYDQEFCCQLTPASPGTTMLIVSDSDSGRRN